MQKKSILILMRHGQSVWNQKNLFTGWVDIPLSPQGVEESIRGGKKIANLPIDIVFTSTLIRAHQTLLLSLMNHTSKKTALFQHEDNPKLQAKSKIHNPELENEMIPVYQSSALNERYYGDLQGLNKADTAKKYGDAQVKLWRRSFDTPPPSGESLAMTAERTIPYFQNTIVPQLNLGKSVFICAHGNSLRSICMHLDSLTKEEVLELELATGEPIIYEWNEGVWTKTTLT